MKIKNKIVKLTTPIQKYFVIKNVLFIIQEYTIYNLVSILSPLLN